MRVTNIKWATIIRDVPANLFDEEGSRGSQKKLFASFNKIILAFRNLRIQKEQGQLLLRSTVEQTGAGILVLDPSGKVEICNRAFQNLMGLTPFSQLEHLLQIHPLAYRSIRKISPGKQEMLEFCLHDPKSFEPDDHRHVLLNAREIVVEGRKMKVITIHNIQNEIEQRESDAWEKLLRIFSHEILNSVSPINLLAASLIEMMEDKAEHLPFEKMDPEDIKKALLALKTIKKRGQGLIDFVESYRAVTKIPEPVLQDLKVSGFFREIITLLSPELENHGISIMYKVDPEDMKIRADETLLQQALINIVKNSIDALKLGKEPAIRLEATLREERPVLSVIDNGTGISPEIMGNIFTPFFTSREEGSGIGLSFARQVMRMHHGKISASSTPGEGSIFSLNF